MTQKDKELLLKDLCARLPYGVKGIVEDGIKVTTPSEWPVEKSIEFSMRYMVIKNGWRPCLFPLSSMNKEQQKEANIFDDMDMDILSENLGRNHRNKTNIPTATYNYIDWLNKNHFDYRGLIEKGLALDATGLNIY